MPLPSIDFGVFIAYLVPGIIALIGLALVIPQLRAILRTEGGHFGIGGAIIVAILALTIGRVISIGRSALVDATFGVALPFLNCSSNAQFGAIPALAPDYRQMIQSGRREAFMLAIANEQRPYQFCGNTLLAVFVLAVCWLFTLPQDARWRPRAMLVAALALFLMVVLYGGARSSYYGYMRATAAINGTPFAALDRLNKPCAQSAFSP